MGLPNSEVGYTIATTRRENHEVHKNRWWHWEKKKKITNLLLLSHLHTFQLKVYLLHDHIKLIPVWLRRGHRMSLYPTPTSKRIEVFTGVHTHIKTLLQLCSYRGWGKTHKIRNKFLQTKSYLILQITKRFKDTIDHRLNKQNISNAAYQLPYIRLFHKHDFYCVS